jgi:hypothetical protein
MVPIKNLLGDYATVNILPKPAVIEAIEEDRVRARALHLIKGDTRLIVAYLNHGIV